ncbi:MAG: HD domain-containing phosphohydrolase [Chloroflexota bacterium]
MNREEVLYLIPYLLSLLLSVGIFFYSWAHRRVRGARAYTWFVGGQTLSIFGFIMELVTPNLEIKIVWDKFQWLTESGLIVIAFVAFAIQFADHKPSQPTIFWTVLLAIPIVFNALVVTDGFHHLIYPNPHLTSDYPYPDLAYDFTTAIYVFALYIYIATFFGAGLLVRRALQPHNSYRGQFLVIAAGFALPIALTIFPLFFNIKLTPQRDIFPFSIALGNLIIAWGLFRYRVFDIVPIARERVLENMTDPVVVVDALDRVVDINRAALDLIGKFTFQVIGRSSDEVFSEWGDLVEKFRYVANDVEQIAVRIGGETSHYEVKISSIVGRSQERLGRVVVAHDVTRLVKLEEGYRLLSEELEQRVRERTEEFLRSEERFSKAFQESPVILIITEFESTKILEVNETFERITGYSRQEAVGQTTLGLGFWVNPEDRERLLPVLRAGGGFRNEELQFRIKNGAILTCLCSAEMIEVGGEKCALAVIEDITERKQAQEKLAEAYDTTLQGWAKALEFRDKETEGHSRRVTETTMKLARAVGVPEEELIQIYRGAILHDIGKMAIPDEILRKTDKLNEQEWEIVRRHPLVAYELLSPIPYLKNALDIPYCHHEKWNGTGYPRGLKGEEIPLAARIFSIADVWDAIQSDRPYNRAWPKEKALIYMKEQSGKYFDPRVVDLFVKMVESSQA